MSEWIPVKRRRMNKEETTAFFNKYRRMPDEDEVIVYCGQMPDDEQEILVTINWRLGGSVYADRCLCDTAADGEVFYALARKGNWENVSAWMPVPEPYVAKEENKDV